MSFQGHLLEVPSDSIFMTADRLLGLLHQLNVRFYTRLY